MVKTGRWLTELRGWERRRWRSKRRRRKRGMRRRRTRWALTLGVGQEAVEKRDGCARGDSDGVVLREAVSRGNTCTPREMMESGI